MEWKVWRSSIDCEELTVFHCYTHRRNDTLGSALLGTWSHPNVANWRLWLLLPIVLNNYSLKPRSTQRFSTHVRIAINTVFIVRLMKRRYPLGTPIFTWCIDGHLQFSTREKDFHISTRWYFPRSPWYRTTRTNKFQASNCINDNTSVFISVNSQPQVRFLRHFTTIHLHSQIHIFSIITPFLRGAFWQPSSFVQSAIICNNNNNVYESW